LTPLESVTISGTAQVGQTLSAATQPAGATATYKWKRADTADGSYTDIASATNASYLLAAEDEGKYIKVEATGTGEYSGTVLSAATTAVAATG
jgi:hypothetical protein